MHHPIYKITSVKVIGPYQLEIQFHDKQKKIIDLFPVLAGEMYAPLRDINYFNQVTIDKEVQTIVWPNGADFDPTVLYNWEENKKELLHRSAAW
ncbi:MAG: DUF2442 domain-containing protein [Bacteroidota bacterium]